MAFSTYSQNYDSDDVQFFLNQSIYSSFSSSYQVLLAPFMVLK